jgi:hypothetical protein
MKPADISVTCVLADKRMISFNQDQPGKLGVLVTYKDHVVNALSPEDIRVKQESLDKQVVNSFSRIDRFGRQAVLKALSEVMKTQPTLDSKCPIYLEVENGKGVLVKNGSVDKVPAVSNLTIIFKKTEYSDRLNQTFGLFPQPHPSKIDLAL